MTSIRLISPTADLHESWIRNTLEWEGADKQGASVFLTDKYGWALKGPEGFSRWVTLLNDLADDQIQPSTKLRCGWSETGNTSVR